MLWVRSLANRRPLRPGPARRPSSARPRAVELAALVELTGLGLAVVEGHAPGSLNQRGLLIDDEHAAALDALDLAGIGEKAECALNGRHGHVGLDGQVAQRGEPRPDLASFDSGAQQLGELHIWVLA